jgi:hypothetical protein
MGITGRVEGGHLSVCNIFRKESLEAVLIIQEAHKNKEV